VSDRPVTGLRHELNGRSSDLLIDRDVFDRPVRHGGKSPRFLRSSAVAVGRTNADTAVPAGLRPLPFAADHADGPVAQRRMTPQPHAMTVGTQIEAQGGPVKIEAHAFRYEQRV